MQNKIDKNLSNFICISSNPKNWYDIVVVVTDIALKQEKVAIKMENYRLFNDYYQ